MYPLEMHSENKLPLHQETNMGSWLLPLWSPGGPPQRRVHSIAFPLRQPHKDIFVISQHEASANGQLAGEQHILSTADQKSKIVIVCGASVLSPPSIPKTPLLSAPNLSLHPSHPQKSLPISPTRANYTSPLPLFHSLAFLEASIFPIPRQEVNGHLPEVQGPPAATQPPGGSGRAPRAPAPPPGTPRPWSVPKGRGRRTDQ